MEREKIMNGLRCHSGCERGFDCDTCAYIGNGDCSELLARDALNLLKEQKEQIERIKERPDDAQMSDEDMAKYVAKLRNSIKIDSPKECNANMTDKKQIMSWLEGLAQDDWPMFHSESEVQEIAKNALELLKEQESIIEQYRRADGFLAAHGWKWEGR